MPALSYTDNIIKFILKLIEHDKGTSTDFFFGPLQKSFSPVWTVQVLSKQSALCIARVRKVTGYMIAFKIRLIIFFFLFVIAVTKGPYTKVIVLPSFDSLSNT